MKFKRELTKISNKQLNKLSYLFQGLIIKRNKQSIDLAKPTTLAINSILQLLDKHFNGSYKAEGASRLPVLAIYASYQCLINEAKRFENKELLAMIAEISNRKPKKEIFRKSAKWRSEK